MFKIYQYAIKDVGNWAEEPGSIVEEYQTEHQRGVVEKKLILKINK